jgi:hypothetical protein
LRGTRPCVREDSKKKKIITQDTAEAGSPGESEGDMGSGSSLHCGLQIGERIAEQLEEPTGELIFKIPAWGSSFRGAKRPAWGGERARRAKRKDPSRGLLLGVNLVERGGHCLDPDLDARVVSEVAQPLGDAVEGHALWGSIAGEADRRAMGLVNAANSLSHFQLHV